MNKETIELLQGLADKFGTTAEHLWAVLVRQAPISSAIDVVCIAGMFWFFVWSMGRINKLKYSGNDEGLWKVLAQVAWAIGAFVVMIWVAASASQVLAGFFNPEYWALHDVLSTLETRR